VHVVVVATLIVVTTTINTAVRVIVLASSVHILAIARRFRF
jgi:hypothetical protein